MELADKRYRWIIDRSRKAQTRRRVALTILIVGYWAYESVGSIIEDMRAEDAEEDVMTAEEKAEAEHEAALDEYINEVANSRAGK